MSYDYLIVGAGFAGSVMARQLAEAGQRVLIIDKRYHIGGNAYDYVNEHGIRIQKYGVHAFHTNSDAIWTYLSRFTEWTPYEHRVKASVGGELVTFPPNGTTLDELGFSRDVLTDDIPSPQNAEEQCLARAGWSVYKLFFEGYTEKHWGRHPRELDASVTARIPFRPNSTEDRVFTDKYQAVPKDGYTALFERMLDHPGIEIQTRFHPFTLDGVPLWPNDRPMIWTGPIDEYFAHRFGRLPYRSLTFHHQTVSGDKHQPCAQINYPASWQPFTRTIEWRWITGQDADCTTITTEFPSSEGEPYYPIPAPENEALYQRYRALAEETPNVTFLGRLGTYRYLNMDQVVGQALATFRRLNNASPAPIANPA